MSLITKVTEYLKYFSRANKKWTPPRSCPILIYNSCGSEFLEDYISGWDYEILHLSGEEINIPALIRSLLARGKRQDAYIDSYIKYVKPKVVITRIDNSLNYYTVSGRHDGLKTISIQNGTRGYYVDIFEQFDLHPELRGKLRIDYMLVFGAGVGKAFSANVAGEIIPVGSFRNNLVKKLPKKHVDLMAFVSQYRSTPGFTMGDKFYSFNEFFEQADSIILPFLSDYAKRKGKRLVIVPSYGRFGGEKLEQEKLYYQKILGNQVVFSDWHWHGSSYETLDSAEVTISIDSSMGLESAARGNKSAIFSFRGLMLGLTNPPFLSFGWPGRYADVGPFWSNLGEAPIFEGILDHLFSIDQVAWRKELSSVGFSDVLDIDEGNKKFSSILEFELTKSRVNPDSETLRLPD